MTKKNFSFENLTAWEEARKLTNDLYRTTREFPSEEKFGMVSQIRRASVSICSNIAEGSSRTSVRDQANFYQMAYSSLMEVLNQTIISSDLGYIPEPKLNELRESIERVSRLINALRKATLKRLNL